MEKNDIYAMVGFILSSVILLYSSVILLYICCDSIFRYNLCSRIRRIGMNDTVNESHIGVVISEPLSHEWGVMRGATVDSRLKLAVPV
jgi:hypothetical protein